MDDEVDIHRWSENDTIRQIFEYLDLDEPAERIVERVLMPLAVAEGLRRWGRSGIGMTKVDRAQQMWNSAAEGALGSLMPKRWRQNV